MDFYSNINIVESDLKRDDLTFDDGKVTVVRHDNELGEVERSNFKFAVTQHDYKLNYWNSGWYKYEYLKTSKKKEFIELTDDVIFDESDANKIYINKNSTKDIIVRFHENIQTVNLSYTFIICPPYNIKIQFHPTYRIDHYYNTIESLDSTSFCTIRILKCDKIDSWAIKSESDYTKFNKYIREFNIEPNNTAIYPLKYNGVVSPIEFINFTSTGDGVLFGDIGTKQSFSASASNGNRGTGIFSGHHNEAHNGPSKQNYYIRFISSVTGDIFCESNCNYYYCRTLCDSGPNNIGVFAGGYNSGNKSDMEYIRTHIPGGFAFDFGDLTIGRGYATSASNSINNRGSCHTAYDCIDGSDYWNMIYPSKAFSFGTLVNKGSYASATSNGSLNRVIRSGGSAGGQIQTMIDYFNLLSLSDSVYFGELTTNRYQHGSTSNKLNNRGIMLSSYGDNSTIDHINISNLGDALQFGYISGAQNYGATYISAASNS